MRVRVRMCVRGRRCVRGCAYMCWRTRACMIVAGLGVYVTSASAATTNEMGGAHLPAEEENNYTESQHQQRLTVPERCNDNSATANWLPLLQHWRKQQF